MRLIIAEKPSLARAIAEALPAPRKREGLHMELSLIHIWQERVLLCWNRLVLPNGDSMDLQRCV